MMQFSYILCCSGNIKRGAATKIYSLLIHDVVIDYDAWTKNRDTTVQLLTWGLSASYLNDRLSTTVFLESK